MRAKITIRCTLEAPLIALVVAMGSIGSATILSRRVLRLLVIPPDVMHWGEVIGDEPVLNLDVFTPKRPEYAA